MLRAYDMRGWVRETSRTHDDQDPGMVIAAVLSNPKLAKIHGRNLVYGRSRPTEWCNTTRPVMTALDGSVMVRQ